MARPYSKLAKWYDQLYDDDYYHQYGAFIKRAAKQYNLAEILLLDIACGTGRLLAELISHATHVAGLDTSAEMLAQAKKRLPDIKFYHQDFQFFEVTESYNLITCTFDSINYILDTKGVIEVFQRVHEYLDNEGIFIFDFNTVHKNTSGTIHKGNITYHSRINGPYWEIDLEIPNGREQHRERLYTLEEMKLALDKSGMKILKIYSDFKTEVHQENSHQRLIIVTQKDNV